MKNPLELNIKNIIADFMKRFDFLSFHGFVVNVNCQSFSSRENVLRSTVINDLNSWRHVCKH